MQTSQIACSHLDIFSGIGLFSGGSGGDLKTALNGQLADAKAFNEKVKVFYCSFGTVENTANARKFDEALTAAGIKHVYYESPGTAHEWQTWRKSLHGFTPLLFKD